MVMGEILEILHQQGIYELNAAQNELRLKYSKLRKDTLQKQQDNCGLNIKNTSQYDIDYCKELEQRLEKMFPVFEEKEK
jgi:hypothetical protein